MKMMQTSCRYLFSNLKHFKYSAYNSFLYTCFFKKQILQNKLHCIRMNLYSPRYFVTTSLSVSLRKKSVSNLEDLKIYMNEGKQFYLKLLTNILHNIKFDNLSSEDARLLFTCCGSTIPDSSKQARNNICQDIYEKLLDCNKLHLDTCHTYIEVCTENAVVLNCKQFLSQLQLEPNQKTYKLLLDNVCEKADIGQALELLEMMKVMNISINEEMFNDLVLAHTIQGGLKSGEIVLRTMKTAQIPETNATKFSILKGILQRNNSDDIDVALQKYPMDFTEGQLLELLEIVGLGGNISFLNKIKHLYDNVIITRDFISAIEKICIHLVHMDKCESAMTIYEEFVDSEKDQNYGFFILKEMLHCDVDIKRIIQITKHLRDTNLNDYALENLTEIALRHNYTQASWKLLENMPNLRPHFFWPLLLDANRKEGELGIFSVLQKMVNMGVNIDLETMHKYVFPFCNFDDPKLIIKKLNHLNITVKEAVNALLIVLLQSNKLKQAADLCNIYNVNISGEKLFQLICTSWISSNNRHSIVALLQRFCESNYTKKHLVGDFLTETLNSCKNSNDFIQYVKLLELLNEKKLRINATTADILHKLSTACRDTKVSEQIKDGVDKLLDFDLNSEPVHIPHPRNMTIDELECHLLELREKNMETRGVLRKLIQQHISLGNLDRVNELREQFLSAGYEETIGMKSSLMHNYIKAGNTEKSLSVYNEIKISDPHFKIDSFKVIDLATLLVKGEKYDEAMNILESETTGKKVMGGPAIERNCWQLLDSYENAEEQLKMFQFLVENGYCKPTNVIFGPMVRIHLKRGDLQKSVNIYLNCANDYKYTPLQFEIIKELLKEQNERLLQSVIEATQKVHGLAPTQTALIAAMAENGQEKAIQKFFAENKLDIKRELQKRCNRWVQEGKVNALRILAKACERLSPDVFDVNVVYNCIMQTYSLNNDYKSALEFYEQLLEKDIILDKQLKMQLNKLQNCNIKESINSV